MADITLNYTTASSSEVYAHLNAIIAAVNAELTKIGRGVKRSKTTTQSIATGTITRVTFNATRITDASHGHTLNADGSITIGAAGKYTIGVRAQFQDNTGTAGYREVGIRVNGNTISSQSGAACYWWAGHCSTFENLAAGAVVEAFAYQNSGAALQLNNDNQTWFEVIRASA